MCGAEEDEERVFEAAGLFLEGAMIVYQAEEDVGRQEMSAYKNFGKKLSEFLTSFLPRYGIDLPTDTKFPIKLSKEGKVCFAPLILTILVH